ncbi:MAG TPA: hypothetical protein VG146_13155 [Verrucomicrobiae bacterium]|nr:hypothetical protein [Verrucomicrobiae bacterium]
MKLRILTFSTLIVMVLGGAPVRGQSSARFAITRSVIASGGATLSASARFQLASTVGQPLASVPASARFSVQGGYFIQAAPILFPPAIIGTNLIFSFQTESGEVYIPQYRASLTTGGWQNLSPGVSDGTVKTTTNSLAGSAQMFFRLLER